MLTSDSTFRGVPFGWFHPVTTFVGPAHWSTRHGSFVTLHPVRPAEGIDGAGPRRIAWGKGFVAIEHVVGATLAELLERVPLADLHLDVRGYVARQLLPLVPEVARQGWPMPVPGQIHLGFDGAVIVDVVPGASADFGPAGYPDSPTREARNDAREWAFDTAAINVASFLRRTFGVSDADLATETDPGRDVRRTLATLLASVFAERAGSHRQLTARCQRLPAGVDPPPGWDDVLLQAERARVAGIAARAQTLQGFVRSAGARLLVEAVRDGHEYVHPPVWGQYFTLAEAPSLVARVALLRELSIAEWTRAELVIYQDMLTPRLLAVLRARGLAISSSLLNSEHSLRAFFVNTMLAGASTPLRRIRSPIDGFPALSAALAKGVGGSDDAGVAEDRARLLPHGLIAIATACERVFDGLPHDVATQRWRERWLEIEAELGDIERLRLSTETPHFFLPPAEAIAAEMRARSEEKAAEHAAEHAAGQH